MARQNYNLIRLVRRCIRMLKREYGGEITVYQPATSETSYRTGQKTSTHNSTYIKRAVVLPAKLTRDVYQSISVISANKRVVQGGSFDTGLRRFIIDRRDVPAAFEIRNDYWVVYKRQRYDVKIVEEFEYETGWIVHASKVEGAPVHQDLCELVGGYELNLTHTVEAVIT